MPRIMPAKPPASAASFASSPSTHTLHIAVQGCCHGELDKIYAECKRHEDNWGKKIDMLLCCGDFQSITCEGDLDSMAVPAKYRSMGDFHHYCCSEDEVAALTSSEANDDNTHNVALMSTKRVAPYLTIFIGGNHEASNVLFKNYYGGYIAPNVYYVGHSGVIDVKGLRLAGLSGIWKHHDRFKPYPQPPYDDGTVRSAYHVREYEVEKLQLFNALCQQQRRLKVESEVSAKEGGGSSDASALAPSLVATDADARPVDIVLSHDWPVGITKYGDEAQLLRYKPYFGPDIEKGELGNPLTMGLLAEMRPRYWCSAHLHCFFSASVSHTETQRTQFLALDKCVKDKSFLDFIDIVVPADNANAADGTGSSADANGIRIPSLWQETLRLAQPALDQSYQLRDLRLGNAGISKQSVEAVQLKKPLPGPIAVGLSTNVGSALVRNQSGAKRVREELEGVVPDVSFAVPAALTTTTAPAATTEVTVDDWLIEG